MPELLEASTEDLSKTMARSVCGLLLIWTGAALFLQWSWGVGLVGAGVILLGAQAVRKALHLKLDGFGVVAGSLLVIYGVWSMLDVSLDLVPLLLIVAGIALLVSSWSARRTGRTHREPVPLQAPSHTRA